MIGGLKIFGLSLLTMVSSLAFAMSNNEEVITKAEKALVDKIYVVTDKEAMPPSGDKHDYISMGPYWWPNPDTADGLPYIRKDGEVNPERNRYTDQAGISSTFQKVKDLGEAYFQTEDERYAERAVEIVYNFFVCDQTRMNPNLVYGQFVPGICEGRGIGIIETGGIAKLFEGVALVRKSKSWNKSVDRGLKVWAEGYLEWLQTHPYGIEESVHPNNHGTHYDAQSLAIYLFLGDKRGAKSFIERLTLDRIADQVAPDGSQPRELARTKSWNYSTMNLRGWVEIANMADEVGVDLWNYAPNGQCYMRSMVDWFIPYLDGEKSWEWKQIASMSLGNVEFVFENASRAYDDKKYNSYIEDQILIR